MNGNLSMIDRSVEVCPDPEELAAYIDRVLPTEDRRRIAEHLSRCPDCYEVFSETVRLLEEGDEEETGSEEPSAQSVVRRGPWNRVVRFAGPLAAALVVAFGVSLLLPRLLGPWHALSRGSSRGAVASLDLSELPKSRVADLANDQVAHGWSPDRGGGRSERPPGGEDLSGFERATPKTSFQLGVLSLDLSLALRHGDVPLSKSLIDNIDRLLSEDSVASGLFVASFDDLETRLSSGEAPEVLARGWEDLESLLLGWTDEPSFRFGLWAEAGRLAAAAGDRRFLDRMAAEGAAAAVEDPPVMEVVAESVDRELGSILARTRGGVAADDLAPLEKSFAEIVSLAGGGWGAAMRQP